MFSSTKPILSFFFCASMFFAWLVPIFAGLLLAAPLVRWSGRADWGQALRRRGILLVPSETRPPSELRILPGEGLAEHPGGVEGAGSRSRSMSSMHEAERALFDLRRGRPLCLTSPGAEDGRSVLCASVEGLDPVSLDALKRLGYLE